MRSRILVVGRDLTLRARLARMLSAAGYGVELAESAAGAQQIGVRGVSLAIIVPDGLGREGGGLIERLQRTIGKVLLFSTMPGAHARGAERLDASDEAGLLARVAGALRPGADASTDASEPVLQFAGFRLDHAGRSLLDRDGRDIPLTRGEFDLLTAFVQRPGRVLSRDYLRQILVGRESEAFDRSVDMLMVRLRRKIEHDPKHPSLIVTVPGAGYKFAARVREAAAIAMADAESAAAWQDAAPPVRERRYVTALAADLAGTLPRDPEELSSLLAAYRRFSAAVIARHGGVMAQCRLREVLAYFGYPIAQEHAAERAIHAALALTEQIGAGGADLPSGLAVSVGVASGLVVADPAGEVLGEPPDEAARLSALAAPGQVAAAADTRRLAGGLFAYREVAPRAWQVLGATAASSRSEALYAQAVTPLVGREEELSLLLRAWHRAKSGDGRLILLSGEPGIGKSRLLAALEEALAGELHSTLRYFCSPLHQDAPLHPVIARWQQEAGFASGDSAAARLRKLEAILVPANLPREDVAEVAALLSVPTGGRYPEPDLSPQRRKERTFAALRHRLDALTRERPVVMLFEDAHWADPSSLDLLDGLVERLAGLKVLLVISYRSEFVPPWVGHAGASLIALSRLDQRQSAALAVRVAGERVLAPPLLARIVGQADGVPLFTEELTKAVLEEAESQDAPAGAHAVPASLQALLMARLDRVPAATQVAQAGGAIGREFSRELLLAAAELPEATIQQGLDGLVRAGLMLVRGTPPHASYAFKHALVQDAAYGSLLRAERRRLHGRITAALEGRADGPGAVMPDLLAHHATEAGLFEKAATWRLRAGLAALQRGAAAEALAQLGRGLTLLPAMAEDDGRRRLELDLRIGRMKALMAAEGHTSPRLREEFDRAQALCVALGASSQLIAVMFGRWTHAFVRGEFALARRYGADLLAIGRDRDDPICRLLGHYTSGLTALPLGAFEALVRHLRGALAQFDPAWRRDDAMPTGVADPRVVSGLYLAWGLMCQGRIGACRAEAEAALAEARRLAQPWTLAQALSISAFLALTLDSPQAGLRWLDELRPLAKEHCFVYFQAMGSAQRGWCLAAQGEPAQGAALLRAGIEPLQKAGSRLWVPSLLRAEAEALGGVNRMQDAHERLDDAIRLATETGALWDLADMHRVRGALLQAQGAHRAAEDALVHALTLARDLGARLLALRAAAALAGLRAGQGRRAEAQAALAPVLAWFDEEEGALDLQRARLLFDTLGARAAAH